MGTGVSVPAGQELLCRAALGSQQILFLPAQLHDPASAESPAVFGCKFIVLPEGWSRRSVSVLGQCEGELASPASPAVCAQFGVHLSTLTGH